MRSCFLLLVLCIAPRDLRTKRLRRDCSSSSVGNTRWILLHIWVTIETVPFSTKRSPRWALSCTVFMTNLGPNFLDDSLERESNQWLVKLGYTYLLSLQSPVSSLSSFGSLDVPVITISLILGARRKSAFIHLSFCFCRCTKRSNVIKLLRRIALDEYSFILTDSAIIFPTQGHNTSRVNRTVMANQWS